MEQNSKPGKIIQMGGSYILTLLSAVLSCAMFPKLNLFWLSYICLVPALLDLDRTRSLRLAFSKGLVYGLILMGFFHCWMWKLVAWASWFKVIFLWLCFSLYLAIFYGFIFLGYYMFLRAQRNLSIFGLVFVFPCLWTVAEWLKMQGPLGNPAGSIGYTQTGNIFFLQFANMSGVLGLSFSIALINMLVFVLFFKTTKHSPQRKALLGIFIIVISLLFFYGKQRLGKPVSIGHRQVVSIIQANHPQKDKLDPSKWNQIRFDYLSLSEQACKQAVRPHIILWPETFVPVLNLQNYSFMEQMRHIAGMYKVDIVFGTPVHEGGKYFNSIALMTPKGLSPQLYHKVRLMPFGEFIPFRDWIGKTKQFHEALAGADFSPGPAMQKPMTIRGVAYGGGICLESVYPGYFRSSALRGARVLVVLVNNAWFFTSSAAQEHLQMSILRAVENNRYLIQVANTGISAIIDNTGVVIQRTQLEGKRILTGRVDYSLRMSFYTRFGDWIVLLSGIYLCLAFFLSRRGRA